MYLNSLKLSFDVAWSPDCIDGRCYDVRTMAPFLDLFFIMSYDERSQIKTGPCVAGPNSGYLQTVKGLLNSIHETSTEAREGATHFRCAPVSLARNPS